MLFNYSWPPEVYFGSQFGWLPPLPWSTQKSFCCPHGLAWRHLRAPHQCLRIDVVAFPAGWQLESWIWQPGVWRSEYTAMVKNQCNYAKWGSVHAWQCTRVCRCTERGSFTQNAAAAFFFLKIVKNSSCQRNAHGALAEGGIWAEIKVQPDCTDWILSWYKSLPPAGLTNCGAGAPSPEAAVPPVLQLRRCWDTPAPLLQLGVMPDRTQKIILTSWWPIQMHIFIGKFPRFNKDEIFRGRDEVPAPRGFVVSMHGVEEDQDFKLYFKRVNYYLITSTSKQHSIE